MRTPIAIFPYTSQLLPVVNHFEKLQDEYYIKELISLPGLGLSGKEASFACNRTGTKMIVTDTLEIKDSSWQTLLLNIPPGEKAGIGTYMLNVMEKTLDVGKSIIYCNDSRTNIPKNVWDMKDKYKDKVLIRTEKTNPFSTSILAETYNQILTPIILVGSLVESSDSLEVLLCLASQFKDHDMRPTVITKQPIGRFFGFHTLNNLIDQHDETLSQKIENINYFIATLEMEEMPSVIIIEAPDAIMRFSDAAPNGFGILTYLVSQAMTIDSLICCVPFELAVNELLEMLSRDFSFRIGSPIHAVHVSNIIVDSAQVMETHKITYVHANLNLVQNQIRREFDRSSIPLFDVVSDGSEKLYQFICGLLDLQ